MQVDVRQQRGNHPTLRSPSNRPLDTLLGQHTCSQPLTDQFQHPPIRNPPPNLAHEHLMVKVVEKNPGYRPRPHGYTPAETPYGWSPSHPAPIASGETRTSSPRSQLRKPAPTRSSLRPEPPGQPPWESPTVGTRLLVSGCPHAAQARDDTSQNVETAGALPTCEKPHTRSPHTPR